MRKLLLRWAISAAAVYVAMYVASDFGLQMRVDGDWTAYFLIGLILGLVNALLAPLVKALTCPLILLTLGLFTLVINGAMLWVVSAISEQLGIGFYVGDFWSAFWGALIISVVSFVLSVLTGVNRKEKRR